MKGEKLYDNGEEAKKQCMKERRQGKENLLERKREEAN